jgi:pimeloyl-ACP methyl ester carboxylesterase
MVSVARATRTSRPVVAESRRGLGTSRALVDPWAARPGMRATTRALLCATTALVTSSCGGSSGSPDEATADSSALASADVRVTNQDVLVHHTMCGEGDLTLLFVHGWAIDHTYWSSQVEEFCPEHRVVTIDLPGHGASGTNRDSWTVEAFASDVTTVIEQLHLDDVILIGHSMGGDVVLEAGIGNDAVIALVGVDTFKDVGTEYTPEIEARIAAFVDQLRTNFDSAAVAYSRRALFQPTTDSAVMERVIRSEVEVDSTIAATALAELFDYAPREADRLARLQKPLYLINSSATPTDTVGLSSTGVRFRVLDVGRTGHYPMIEDPAAFNRLLREVVEDVGSGVRR